jgi:hypothetical protein
VVNLGELDEDEVVASLTKAAPWPGTLGPGLRGRARHSRENERFWRLRRSYGRHDRIGEVRLDVGREEGRTAGSTLVG